MIDSVLKGTGNSRFLKSAVPAGISWADALAMLQAGTFPIDFNGINAEGFQQVGTPLNKANLLKDATAAQIGLPPSTTPDGMFQALGNTGELHVWRKTVVTGTAKVELEPAVSGYIVSNNGSNYNQTIKYSSTIDEKGNLSGTITTLTVAYNTSNSDLFVLKGKYFEAGTTEISSNLKSPGGVWYIPNDASIQYITGQPNTTGYPYYYTHVATKMQKVVYVPAGTTTTYPVSTNPNAFQEGDDAKEAGYVVGEVVTGEFLMSDRSNSAGVYVGTTLSANSDGTVNIVDYSVYGISNNSNGLTQARMTKGKYIKYQANNGDFNAGDVWFIPSDASIEYVTNGIATNKRQPVTGYAAIPAGTTIEYLGKLGDKARVQVVSYVGTGTYGSSNPNSLTFDFAPKVVMFLRYYKSGITQSGALGSYGSDSRVITPESLTTTYAQYNGFGDKSYSYAKKSKDGKTIFWYNDSSFHQGNDSGYIYYFLVIG
jgi:hypothetical protein